MQVNGPTVLTVTNDDSNVMRFAKVRDVMMSSRKPIANWNLAVLGLSTADLHDPTVELIDLYVPEQPIHAEMIEGDSAQERATKVARRLRELNVL